MGARRTVGLAGLVRGVGSLLAALTVALAVLLARPAAARAELFMDVCRAGRRRARGAHAA